MTDLATIQAGWNHAAIDDAFFNIVTHQGRENGGWTPEEFFAHGQVEIDAMLAHLGALRGERKRAALDFGCGVGRLTQALVPEYALAWGCDISEEMIRLANEHNRHGKRCRYVQSGASLLDSFKPGTFDLIYSRITLQHMPPELQRGYVEEFIQLLAPKGLAVFQVPDGPDYRHPNEWLSMYGVPRETVEDWIWKAGGTLLDVELLADSNPTWLAYRYTVTP